MIILDIDITSNQYFSLKNGLYCVLLLCAFLGTCLCQIPNVFKLYKPIHNQKLYLKNI